MERHVLSLLCDPDTRYPLEMTGNNLRNTATGRIYPIRDDIPLFVSTVKGPNLKYQTMYDYIAPGYDLAERFYNWARHQSDYREEFLKELEIKRGDRVLEVSVGTGANIRNLPDGIDFYGLDLSWGMLRKCQRNLRHWDRKAHLFHGEAERLPFKVEAFDCVYHVGGINHFTDKLRAIKEMIWVAKSGTKIVIADEIEKGSKEGLHSATAREQVEPKGDEIQCPIDLIPEEMLEVRARAICNGKMFCLTFRKP
jgi:ubiquinone/menaquinone biosynthesis C-methylase UbiE